jgi:hypothetical protein
MKVFSTEIKNMEEEKEQGGHRDRTAHRIFKLVG